MPTVLIEKNVMVAMRDGVRLAADVYRMEGAAPAPVLLARTPYDKENIIAASSTFDILRAVQAGYVVVVQDVRGRFASAGTFNPHFQERRDGVETIAWAASQPWSSGVVGMFGNSYLGGAHVFHGLRWAVAIAGDEIARKAQRGSPRPRSDTDLDVRSVLHHLPLDDHPLLREVAPFYFDWLNHPTADAYWHPIALSAGYEQIGVPALNITGWYDIFLWSTLQNYQGMRARGGTGAARRNQRLIIGPWTHSNFTGSFPEREFGHAAASDAIDLTGHHVRWFERWLKEVDNGVDHEPPVLLFVMGIDRWRAERDWPLPDTQFRSYYLHSAGSANTLQGDGRLSEDPPGDEPADAYLYNPLRPVPTLGGQVLLPGANAAGPRDQRTVEVRDDVLVYDGPELERPVEVTGPIEARVFIASSALDTDFTGKLVDVHPDGRAMILTEGIFRARYRSSFTAPEPLDRGSVYELRIDLWATSNVFSTGHRMRLEMSSSNFPRFGRNSSAGGNIAKEGPDEYLPAINRVFHDEAHPSRLILPIIQR